MSERKTVAIELYRGSVICDDQLRVLIDWLLMKLQEIPEQVRNSATFDFFDEDGDGEIEISIAYYRPETDEELSRRMAWDERKKELERQAMARQTILRQRSEQI